ncbi:DUF732 domain-containing protein [Sinomonas sp. ASV322]|uniref:DUF732 domain-containing protein n=1 Tax=Sinomonas sp. ASV322 TaxID=3041920 RepID=UPI0027DBC5C8|nr:DUF732 domain-containing protein [Sinomonas sp. ASV322]MDQ4504446.1 hypothetical protein [Sinomonas sp. ASV322]
MTASDFGQTPKTSAPAIRSASDQAFLAKIHQGSPELASVSDATLIAVGTTFCARLREGIPARLEMENEVRKISSMWMNGEISTDQETKLTLGIADIEASASINYCSEQYLSVMRAFAQMASGN